jgi:SAM-dependent methyltransferase
MDLRPFSLSAAQLDRARNLVVRGLITYQPWLFADTLESGVGLEFELDEHVGLVYYPDIDAGMLESPQLLRIIVDPHRLAGFRTANAELRRLYDHFVERIADVTGGLSGSTTLDVGCNTGYFPMAFSRLGAVDAVGCDRQDFSSVFALLNEILGTRARFVSSRYDPHRQEITGVGPADIVTSMAVLCHVSDPLQHLACLGRLARKALFVWTLVNRSDGLTVEYGEPRGDYPGDAFPYCFDNMVCPSLSMARRSFELMGFKKIIDLPGCEDNVPRFSVRGFPFHGILGLR